jgi:hypothetical protein
MKKLLIVLSILATLGGCSSAIPSYQIERAIFSCKDEGGLYKIQPLINNRINVTCQSGKVYGVD